MKKTQKNENVLLAYHRVSSAEQASGGPVPKRAEWQGRTFL